MASERGRSYVVPGDFVTLDPLSDYVSYASYPGDFDVSDYENYVDLPENNLALVVSTKNKTRIFVNEIVVLCSEGTLLLTAGCSIHKVR